MSRNGSGTFSLLSTLAPPGQVSNSTAINALADDIAAGLTDSLNVDGTKASAANQSLGGFKITNLGAGTTANDSVRLTQSQSGTNSHAATVAGTVNVITAVFSPVFTAYVTNMRIRWTSTGVNTITAPTINIDGLGAKTIKKGPGDALDAGDTGAAGYICEAIYNGTDFILLTPAVAAALVAATTTNVLNGVNTTRYVTPAAEAALWIAGADITDAGTITIGDGGYFNLITSTTAITAFTVTTSKAGRTFRVRFNTVRTLTYNATSLILPTGASITTAVGDICQVRDLGSGNVVVEWYTRASGVALAVATSSWTTVATLTPSAVASVAQTGLSGYKALRIIGMGIIPATNSAYLEVRISSDGATYLTTNYSSTIFKVVPTATASALTATGAFRIIDTDGTTGAGNGATDGGVDFNFVISDFNTAQKTRCMGNYSFGASGGAHTFGTLIGWHTGQTAMQAIQFIFSAGNITSGTIIIEGLA